MKHSLSLKTGDAALSEADTVLIKDEMFEEVRTQQRLFIREGGEWTEEHKQPILKRSEDG